MGDHREPHVDISGGLGCLVAGTCADVYWHSQKRLWSVRIRGRVVGHVGFLTLARCQFVVREGERARALERGQRSVHAWVRGQVSQYTLDNTLCMFRIGYSYRDAAHFTVRPGFVPIYSARLVTFHPLGHAYALP
jgi:hypothetical protein